MSVPVALQELAEQVATFGPVAYVVTADDRSKSHVVSVAVDWREAELVLAAGKHTSANVEGSGTVTLLWPAPPGEPYSLIVDGDGRLDPDDGRVAIRPTRAVLHRVAQADAALPSCVTVLDA